MSVATHTVACGHPDIVEDVCEVLIGVDEKEALCVRSTGHGAQLEEIGVSNLQHATHNVRKLSK